MKATSVTKFGFICPVCSEVHTPDSKLDTYRAWKVEDDIVNEKYILENEPEEVEVYKYDEDGDPECVGEAEPEYSEVWQCGECEEKYLDQDEAKECCKG